MDTALTTKLACPNCVGRIGSDDGDLVCVSCGTRYLIVDGVPCLLPSEQLGRAWDERQELGLEEYRAGEDDSAERVARAFASFADLHGLVLDIGCGITRRPEYFTDDDSCTYVGIDPLHESVERDFEFVQAIGEHLPFADETFDCVISATMLDHVPDPERILSEAHRVLKPNGKLAVWVGVVDTRALEETVRHKFQLPDRRPVGELLRRHGPRGVVVRMARHFVTNRVRSLAARVRLRWRRSAVVDEVYADRSRYHFRFFEAEEVIPIVTGAGFRAVKTDEVVAGTSGRSLFVLAERAR